ncbi:hypothetical protein J4Q44_G00042310 [Coregonus suidteri]|uniref:HAT C-terminal dimerisation domain-containing protein n=1 Tax=Coregonus suidteri TaxID=861788 RepID=A0AAN8R641_9TELE
MPTTAELEKLQVMESSDDDPANVVRFKPTITTDLEKRKENTNLTWLKIATALDPRLKHLKCLPRPERGEVWALVSISLKEERPAQQPDKATESEPPKKAALLLSASESDEEEESIKNVVECYKAEPSINMEDCPLQWWSQQAGAHTRLACIA